jgi:hypothetical protein
MDRHWTFSLGVRYDRNNGKDASGTLVAKDSLFSPRLGVVFDPTGTGRTTVNASFSRYVAAIANSIAGETSPAGTPAIFAYFYEGPDINTGEGPLVPPQEAIQQVFDWYTAAQPDPFVVVVPGVDTRVARSVKSPHSDELAVGVSRLIGERGALRVDVTTKKFADFYSERIDTTTGQVLDEFGTPFDLRLVENTNAEKRRYASMAIQGNYRFGARLDVGANYTLSRLWGTLDGETSASGPVPTSAASYPEYFDPSWGNPEGDLSADQRHRLRAWANVELIGGTRNSLVLSALSQAESGTPYGAVGAVSTLAFVDNPGYVTPPEPESYFFTARDAFHTEAMYRTDLALRYARRIGRSEAFAKADLLNVFNQFQLFNGSNNDINTTVLTAFDDPDRFATFNPFTDTPVQGVNWDYGSKFGQARGAAAYTVPRTFRFSVGFRF